MRGKMKMMMRGKVLLAGGLIALAALVMPAGLAGADQVRIEPVPQAVPPAVTIYESAPQTLQADEIKAQRVRATTIYANTIEAPEIQGQIFQTKDVKVSAHGDIKAPEVSASVIYAEKITANSVVAQNIYVRNLERR